MIRLSCLTPIPLLEALSPEYDYDFIEPYTDRRYVDHYRQSKRDLKLLDNGLIELGEAVTITQLKEYAVLVRATHVISPDKLGDWLFNKYWAQELSRLWPKEHIFVCLAGGTVMSDWVSQRDWVEHEQFAGYCLPYRLARRPMFVDDMCPAQHLLGLKWPEPYSEYGDATLDTTEPINAALHGWVYERNGGVATYPRKTDYMLQPDLLLDLRTDDAISNIRYLKRRLNNDHQPKPR